MHALEAGLARQVDHDARRRAALLGQAEAAVADPPAGGAHPLSAAQHLHDVLPVAVLEARGAELAPDAVAVSVVADGLRVGRLLAALVAGGAVDLVVDLLRAAVDDAPGGGQRAGRLAVELDREGLGVGGEVSHARSGRWERYRGHNDNTVL